MKQQCSTDSPSGKLCDSVEASDFAEVIRNGEPIDWRYWFGQARITPEQAAKLTYCIDPITWAGDRCAQGPIDDGLRKKIAKLENALKSAAEDFTLPSVLAFLGDSFAPYNMAMAASCAPNVKPQPGADSLRESRMPVPASLVTWSLKTPRRYQGYRKPLYDYLKAAQLGNRPIPKARDALDAFKNTRPADIIEVMSDGLKFCDGKGNTSFADVRAIQKAIDRLIG